MYGRVLIDAFGFRTLADELATFDEELVARQLGTLLLSRLVLLNNTAQDFLLPRLFAPKDGEPCFLVHVLLDYTYVCECYDFETCIFVPIVESHVLFVDNESSLFTKPVFKNYILPRLLNVFSLRDSQIRLILLKHFASFGSVFSREQLQNTILPEVRYRILNFDIVSIFM